MPRITRSSPEAAEALSVSSETSLKVPAKRTSASKKKNDLIEEIAIPSDQQDIQKTTRKAKVSSRKSQQKESIEPTEKVADLTEEIVIPSDQMDTQKTTRKAKVSSRNSQQKENIEPTEKVTNITEEIAIPLHQQDTQKSTGKARVSSRKGQQKENIEPTEKVDDKTKEKGPKEAKSRKAPTPSSKLKQNENLTPPPSPPSVSDDLDNVINKLEKLNIQKEDEVKKLQRELEEKNSKIAELMALQTKGVSATLAQQQQKQMKKDPHRPKKNLSSYLFFAKDVRDSVRQAHPDKSMLELSSIIGEIWKTISVEDKKKYEELARQDVERYNEELKSYLKTNEKELEKQAAIELYSQHAEVQKAMEFYYKHKDKMEQEEKDDKKPKRPLSSYMLFSIDQRQKVKTANPSASFGEIQKIISAQWNQLGAKAKKVYEDKAAKATEEYKQLLKEYEDAQAIEHQAKRDELEEGALKFWKQQKKQEEAMDMLKEKTKEKRLQKQSKKNSTSPKKARSAYNFFMSEKLIEKKSMYPSSKEAMADIANDWKKVNDKTHYEMLAQKDAERYQREKETKASPAE